MRPGIGQFMVLFHWHDRRTVIVCGRSGTRLAARDFYSPNESWMKQRILLLDDDPLLSPDFFSIGSKPKDTKRYLR